MVLYGVTGCVGVADLVAPRLPDTPDLLTTLDMGVDWLGPSSHLLTPTTLPRGPGLLTPTPGLLTSGELPDLMSPTPQSPDQLGQGFCDTYTDLTEFLFGVSVLVVSRFDKKFILFLFLK